MWSVGNSSATAEMSVNRRLKAEALFPGLEWYDEVTGYCPCPGQHKHTTKAGKRDCQVKVDGTPTVYCVHASCAEEITATNIALRTGIGGAPVVLTMEQKRQLVAVRTKKVEDEAMRVRAMKSLSGILRGYQWSCSAIEANGPYPIQPADRRGMFEAYMAMFDDEDIIWIGDVSDTGRPHHKDNFKTKVQWLAGEIPAGPYTCPSCFAQGSVSRSKDDVASQPYLVVESDSLSKDEVGSIFKWLDHAVELSLRAVVDTAGKSLHGWFEYPTPEVLAELKIMLPAMGCDPKMFGASQPCRLPGGLRQGRVQRLIYSKKGGAL